MNVFSFDIETIPDVELGRRIYGLDDLTDKQVGYVMQTRRREETGSEFLSLEQHKIVAISVALRSRDGFKVWSLGESGAPEHEIIQRFFDGIEKYTPDLVSWNGSGSTYQSCIIVHCDMVLPRRVIGKSEKKMLLSDGIII